MINEMQDMLIITATWMVTLFVAIYYTVCKEKTQIGKITFIRYSILYYAVTLYNYIATKDVKYVINPFNKRVHILVTTARYVTLQDYISEQFYKELYIILLQIKAYGYIYYYYNSRYYNRELEYLKDMSLQEIDDYFKSK